MLVAILGTVVVIAVFVVGGLWLDRRGVSLLTRPEDLHEAQRPRPLGSDHEAGTAPQSALRSDPDRMLRVIERQRCTCATHAALISDGEEDIRYDAKLLRVVRLRCPACQAPRRLYFEPR